MNAAETLNQRLAAGSFDEASAVDIELEPGEMSLHDVYMIHGANANRSTKRRTGVALRYMPTTSVFERDLRPADGKTGLAVDFDELGFAQLFHGESSSRPRFALRPIGRTREPKRCSASACINGSARAAGLPSLSCSSALCSSFVSAASVG